MKQLLLVVMLSCLVFNSICQTKTITKNKEKIGSLICSIESQIDLETSDTVNHVVISYRNAEYTSIVDIGLITFFKDSEPDIKEFIKDLKTALQNMGSKEDLNWRRERYTLNIYDYKSNWLYIEEPRKKGGAWTSINKNNVEKLIGWLDKLTG